MDEGESSHSAIINLLLELKYLTPSVQTQSSAFFEVSNLKLFQERFDRVLGITNPSKSEIKQITGCLDSVLSIFEVNLLHQFDFKENSQLITEIFIQVMNSPYIIHLSSKIYQICMTFILNPFETHKYYEEFIPFFIIFFQSPELFYNQKEHKFVEILFIISSRNNTFSMANLLFKAFVSMLNKTKHEEFQIQVAKKIASSINIVHPSNISALNTFLTQYFSIQPNSILIVFSEFQGFDNYNFVILQDLDVQSFDLYKTLLHRVRDITKNQQNLIINSLIDLIPLMSKQKEEIIEKLFEIIIKYLEYITDTHKFEKKQLDIISFGFIFPKLSDYLFNIILTLITKFNFPLIDVIPLISKYSTIEFVLQNNVPTLLKLISYVAKIEQKESFELLNQIFGKATNDEFVDVFEKYTIASTCFSTIYRQKAIISDSSKLLTKFLLSGLDNKDFGVFSTTLQSILEVPSMPEMVIGFITNLIDNNSLIMRIINVLTEFALSETNSNSHDLRTGLNFMIGLLDLKNDKDKESVFDLFAALTRRTFDQTYDEQIRYLLEKRNYFNAKKKEISKLVYGICQNDEINYDSDHICFPSLISKADEKDIIIKSPFDCWVCGQFAIDTWLKDTNRPINEFPCISQISKRYLLPKHSKMLIEYPKACINAISSTFDQLPLFEFTKSPYSNSISLNPDFKGDSNKSMSFWFMFQEFPQQAQKIVQFRCSVLIILKNDLLCSGKVLKSSLIQGKWYNVFISCDESENIKIYLNSELIHEFQGHPCNFIEFGSTSGIQTTWFIGGAIRFFKGKQIKISEIFSEGVKFLSDFENEVSKITSYNYVNMENGFINRNEMQQGSMPVISLPFAVFVENFVKPSYPLFDKIFTKLEEEKFEEISDFIQFIASFLMKQNKFDKERFIYLVSSLMYLYPQIFTRNVLNSIILSMNDKSGKLDSKLFFIFFTDICQIFPEISDEIFNISKINLTEIDEKQLKILHRKLIHSYLTDQNNETTEKIILNLLSIIENGKIKSDIVTPFLSLFTSRQSLYKKYFEIVKENISKEFDDFYLFDTLHNYDGLELMFEYICKFDDYFPQKQMHRILSICLENADNIYSWSTIVTALIGQKIDFTKQSNFEFEKVNSNILPAFLLMFSVLLGSYKYFDDTFTALFNSLLGFLKLIYTDINGTKSDIFALINLLSFGHFTDKLILYPMAPWCSTPEQIYHYASGRAKKEKNTEIVYSKHKFAKRGKFNIEHLHEKIKEEIEISLPEKYEINEEIEIEQNEFLESLIKDVLSNEKHLVTNKWSKFMKNQINKFIMKKKLSNEEDQDEILENSASSDENSEESKISSEQLISKFSSEENNEIPQNSSENNEKKLIDSNENLQEKQNLYDEKLTSKEFDANELISSNENLEEKQNLYDEKEIDENELISSKEKSEQKQNLSDEKLTSKEFDANELISSSENLEGKSKETNKNNENKDEISINSNENLQEKLTTKDTEELIENEEKLTSKESEEINENENLENKEISQVENEKNPKLEESSKTESQNDEDLESSITFLDIIQFVVNFILERSDMNEFSQFFKDIFYGVCLFTSKHAKTVCNKLVFTLLTECASRNIYNLDVMIFIANKFYEGWLGFTLAPILSLFFLILKQNNVEVIPTEIKSLLLSGFELIPHDQYHIFVELFVNFHDYIFSEQNMANTGFVMLALHFIISQFSFYPQSFIIVIQKFYEKLQNTKTFKENFVKNQNFDNFDFKIFYDAIKIFATEGEKEYLKWEKSNRTAFVSFSNLRLMLHQNFTQFNITKLENSFEYTIALLESKWDEYNEQGILIIKQTEKRFIVSTSVYMILNSYLPEIFSSDVSLFLMQREKILCNDKNINIIEYGKTEKITSLVTNQNEFNDKSKNDKITSPDQINQNQNGKTIDFDVSKSDKHQNQNDASKSDNIVENDKNEIKNINFGLVSNSQGSFNENVTPTMTNSSPNLLVNVVTYSNKPSICGFSYPQFTIDPKDKGTPKEIEKESQILKSDKFIQFYSIPKVVNKSKYRELLLSFSTPVALSPLVRNYVLRALLNKGNKFSLEIEGCLISSNVSYFGKFLLSDSKFWFFPLKENEQNKFDTILGGYVGDYFTIEGIPVLEYDMENLLYFSQSATNLNVYFTNGLNILIMVDQNNLQSISKIFESKLKQNLKKLPGNIVKSSPFSFTKLLNMSIEELTTSWQNLGIDNFIFCKILNIKNGFNWIGPNYIKSPNIKSQTKITEGMFSEKYILELNNVGNLHQWINATFNLNIENRVSNPPPLIHLMSKPNLLFWHHIIINNFKGKPKAIQIGDDRVIVFTKIGYILPPFNKTVLTLDRENCQIYTVSLPDYHKTVLKSDKNLITACNFVISPDTYYLLIGHSDYYVDLFKLVFNENEVSEIVSISRILLNSKPEIMAVSSCHFLIFISHGKIIERITISKCQKMEPLMIDFVPVSILIDYYSSILIVVGKEKFLIMDFNGQIKNKVKFEIDCICSVSSQLSLGVPNRFFVTGHSNGILNFWHYENLIRTLETGLDDILCVSIDSTSQRVAFCTSSKAFVISFFGNSCYPLIPEHADTCCVCGTKILNSVCTCKSCHRFICEKCFQKKIGFIKMQTGYCTDCQQLL